MALMYKHTQTELVVEVLDFINLKHLKVVITTGLWAINSVQKPRIVYPDQTY